LAIGLARPAPAADSAKAPTFTRDVAPIFQEKCQACHRPGYIAPMSLVTYEEVRPWARSIRSRVAARQMPPWHIDRHVGIQKFKNDRSLSDQELETVVRWIDSGSPKGDPKDLPPPKQFANDDVWNYAEFFGGPPDLVIKSTPYTMPALAQDHWWKPEVPTGLTEDRWIRGIEIRPSTVPGRKITHHALARLQQDEDDPLALGGASDVGPGLLMEWAVGKQGEIMRPNSGKLMKAGSTIVWDIHYHAVGEQITDTVELGLYFYPKGQEPTHRQVLASFSGIQGGNRNLDIPPNASIVTENFHVMKQNGRIENFQPHLHLRGKGMQMEAILPDGSRQVLSLVSDYDFNWHNNYVYADDAAPLLPKGTVLLFKTWYDNTANKKGNPDPNQWVGWGDRTVDEMGHAWVNITYLSDEDFKSELEARKAALGRETQQ
jgi:mono/diheme cytochrome c family protein